MHPLPFDEYTGQFFWDFKRMDNVNWNFDIVCTLFSAKKASATPSHFNKPIIIGIMAMIECMMYDFEQRIRGFSSDPFPNITPHDVVSIRATGKTDELARLLRHFRDNNIFRTVPPDSLYDDLEKLNKIRNRVHIQNKHAHLPRTEQFAFSDSNLTLATLCFERICEILCNVYPRWNRGPLPMTQFPRPWL